MALVTILLCVLCVLALSMAFEGGAASLASPSGRVSVALGQAAHGVNMICTFRDQAVLETRVGGLELAGSARPAAPRFIGPPLNERTVRETFATRGAFSSATVEYRAADLAVGEGSARTPAWFLEARAYERAFAWRVLHPREEGGLSELAAEATSWTLPAGSWVWVAERANDWKLKSHAGSWTRVAANELETFSPVGPVQPKPLVLELPAGGFMLLTEAAMFDYPGLRYGAEAGGVLRADLATPGGSAAVQAGSSHVVTPWRVALLAEDLNELVASGPIIDHLCPPADPLLFAGAEGPDGWVRTGRSVWRWLLHDTGNPEQERAMIDGAAEMGYEYALIDDGWKDWPDAWATVKALAEQGRSKGVGVWVWLDSKDIADPADDYALVRAFLDHCVNAGLAGSKIDFFNAEDAQTNRLMERILVEAAKRRLMINFHGCTVPTGWARTYPNEVSREGIRGLELNRHPEGPLTPDHDAALAFTRLVVGHGDYTPVGFSNPGPTTWAHQLAMGVIVTSPMQVIVEDPEVMLRDPRAAAALPILRDLPAAWDETVVLGPSRIAVVTALARRVGESWWVGVVRGEDIAPGEPTELRLDFLPEGRSYQVRIVRDAGSAELIAEDRVVDRAAVVDLPTVRGSGLVLALRPG